MEISIPDNGEVLLEVVPEKELDFPIRLFREHFLCVGPYNNMQEHELHVLSCYGSGSLYGSDNEEILFDKNSSLLRSLWFNLPPEHVHDRKFLKTWAESPSIRGSLRLLSGNNFDLSISNHTFISESGEILIASIDSSIRGNLLRIYLNSVLSLLIKDGTLIGWSLENPYNFLTLGWDYSGPQNLEKSVDLGKAFKEFYELMSSEFVEKMDEQDPEVKSKLLNLQMRVKNLAASEQAQCLSKYISDTIEDFYL